ncbi:hypothetical protein AURDEDRAFT_162290 [Auricularia subglabra TFB-10046 SS5]|nr:hypothetical protein AURDEDRAFT_162290 [Auricularia subglabra TFB-10046 SS5]
MTTPLIPPDVAQGLKSAVKRAASEALKLKAASRGVDDQTHKRLTAELRTYFEEAISDLSGAFNAESTLPGRLSNEVWCIIWSFLPMAALVRATHVCRRWRNVALSCTQLWCHIQFESDMHWEDCDCHLDKFFFGTPRCEDGPGSSNLDAVKGFLARSGTSLPVYLSVNIVGEYTNRDELRNLARALGPSVDRLATIHFAAGDDEEACSLFLKRFDCLPALHTLHSSSNRMQYLGPHGGHAGFLSRPLRLPALRTLELVGALDSSGILPDQLPALQSVEFSSMQPRNVVGYLKVSPTLRQLRLTSPRSIREHPKDALDRARELATARCLDVEICGLTPQCEGAYLAVFEHEGHSNIRLAYDAHTSRPPAGLRILGHLDRVEGLSVYHRPGHTVGSSSLVVAARAPSGKVRALEWRIEPGCDPVRLHETWEHLSQCPDGLLVDARLWTGLGFPARILTGVKKLHVLLDPASDLRALTLPGPFTVLEELKLAGPAKGRALSAAVTALLPFLRAVSVSGVLKKLVLNHIAVDGDMAQLEVVVPRILVQSV